MRGFLKDVFGLTCYSSYNEEGLEWLFGDDAVEFGKHWNLHLYRQALFHDKLIAIKTHEFPFDESPAIVVVRNGLDACASLARYWRLCIRDIILGYTPNTYYFGTWAGFYNAWHPPGYNNRIVVKFEDILQRPEAVIEQVSELLHINPTGQFINHYDECHAKNPRLFSGNGKNHDNFEHNDLELFWRINGAVMKELGYIDEIPAMSRLPSTQQLPRMITVEEVSGGRDRFSSRTTAEIEANYHRVEDNNDSNNAPDKSNAPAIAANRS